MHQKRATFGDVVRVPEFRAIWLADAQSIAGDQIARVSLAILVYRRTGSTGLTALVYALTYLPAIVGGAMLAGIADRFPRKRIMVTCDVIRGALFASAALPSVPLGFMCVLIVLAVLTSSPFSAAESATIPSILEGDLYVVGSGLRATTGQLAQLLGFAAGGVLVSAIGPRWGLLIDAMTFLVSAMLMQRFVHYRPVPPRRDDHAHVPYRRTMLDGARTVFGDPRLRSLMLLAWLAAFYVVPEGLAPAYVAAIGGGAGAVGLIMAADPAGSAIGAGLFVRLVPDRVRSWLIGPLAFGAALPLLVCWLKPSVAVSAALFLAVGLCSAFQIQASTTFMRTVPDHQRGQAFGFAQSGLIAVQGLGIAAFGFIGDHIGAPRAITLAGLIGAVLAVFLGIAWERARRTSRTVAQPVSAPSRPERSADGDAEDVQRRPASGTGQVAYSDGTGPPVDAAR
jgi:MFS family permease